MFSNIPERLQKYPTAGGDTFFDTSKQLGNYVIMENVFTIFTAYIIFRLKLHIYQNLGILLSRYRDKN